ncbi:hypothetical protein COO91_09751 (plasmid) [Nostoc flagelliforme CCNUN1]|uniref:Uncharacterized protein n=1 Tax=Nostoc flagelliforme CCNUN1 TaxID=2038116 RepID=A0A2K8T7E7_9NOSO|nr:hypothetical protein COO91_09751 [Nostoc flagelliforme CCNUN1]
MWFQNRLVCGLKRLCLQFATNSCPQAEKFFCFEGTYPLGGLHLIQKAKKPTLKNVGFKQEHFVLPLTRVCFC